MLFRSLKVPPSLLLALVVLAFIAWQISRAPSYDGSITSQIIPGGANTGTQKTPRIAIMTFVTEQRSYLHLSLKNKDHYARRHGYDFIVDYEAHTDRPVVFWKFDMAERVIKSGKYDWIWWLDFDTLITNTEIKLTDIIEDELANITNPEQIDYLFTHDCNGLNLGSYLIRGHERSLKLTRDSWALSDEAKKEEIHMSEQDAIVKLLKDDKATADRTHVVPQWKMNAFPQEIACFAEPERKVWEHGMFVLHFAGAWAHVKGDDPTGQLMDKYGGEIIWGDWGKLF